MSTQSLAPAAHPDQISRIVSPRQLLDLTGLSQATIWRMVARGDLPRPIRLSPGRVGWPESEIRAWLASRAR